MRPDRVRLLLEGFQGSGVVDPLQWAIEFVFQDVDPFAEVLVWVFPRRSAIVSSVRRTVRRPLGDESVRCASLDAAAAHNCSTVYWRADEASGLGCRTSTADSPPGSALRSSIQAS
jgi:hypothetical protein